MLKLIDFPLLVQGTCKITADQGRRCIEECIEECITLPKDVLF